MWIIKYMNINIVTHFLLLSHSFLKMHANRGLRLLLGKK